MRARARVSVCHVLNTCVFTLWPLMHSSTFRANRLHCRIRRIARIDGIGTVLAYADYARARRHRSNRSGADGNNCGPQRAL